MARGANEFTGVTNAPVTDGDGRLIVVSREDAPLLVEDGSEFTDGVYETFNGIEFLVSYTAGGYDWTITRDANGNPTAKSKTASA